MLIRSLTCPNEKSKIKDANKSGKTAIVRLNGEIIGVSFTTDDAKDHARMITKSNRFHKNRIVTCRWEDSSDVITELEKSYDDKFANSGHISQVRSACFVIRSEGF